LAGAFFGLKRSNAASRLVTSAFSELGRQVRHLGFISVTNRLRTQVPRNLFHFLAGEHVDGAQVLVLPSESMS
jgi:hypothetical protein